MNILNTTSYQLIRDFYQDKRAKRSQVLLINHVHEGLAILEEIGANLQAQEAYCLHPMFQGDAELKESYQQNLENVDKLVLILALEYRNIANQYLSYRVINSIEEINLSPLSEVNQMLIADKIQNRKDFEQYHQATHPRSKELTQYFKNWLQRLEVSEEKYLYFVDKLKKIPQL